MIMRPMLGIFFAVSTAVAHAEAPVSFHCAGTDSATKYPVFIDLHAGDPATFEIGYMERLSTADGDVQTVRHVTANGRGTILLEDQYMELRNGSFGTSVMTRKGADAFIGVVSGPIYSPEIVHATNVAVRCRSI